MSISGSTILFGLKPAVDGNGNPKVVKQQKQNILKDVLSVLKMIVNKRMIFLIPLFACLGFQSIFVNSMYNRQIVKTENVSLYMIVYTVIEMFAGFVHGWGLDKLGLYPMLIIYIFLGMASMILCYYANFWQNASFFILYVLFSLTDSGFQTFVGNSCLFPPSHR